MRLVYEKVCILLQEVAKALPNPLVTVVNAGGAKKGNGALAT